MANPTGGRPRDEGRTSGAGQTAAEGKDRAKDTAAGMAESARDTASSMAGQAREAASSLAGQARDAASSVARQAGSVASAVGDRAEDAASSVASGMQSLAGTIRERAPQEGMMGTAASSVANALESGGRYLQDQGLGGIGDDLANLIRRNPIPALFVGIGIGFLIARATRS